MLHIIQLIPQKLSAERENGAGAKAPAIGQKTRGCIEGDAPCRRLYREVLLPEVFCFLIITSPKRSTR